MCLQRINKEGSMGWDGFDIEAKLDTKKREKKKTFNKKMKNFVAMASRVRVEIKRHKNKMLPPPTLKLSCAVVCSSGKKEETLGNFQDNS